MSIEKPSKLSKNLDTEENREFWAIAEQAHKIWLKWPKWMRELKVTKKHL